MRSLSQYHIEAHHILRYAKMWCALCTHVPYLPRTQAKGDILSCHWLDIIAPQYRSALSLQEAANIAGTPPQVCGRSWESIIIPDTCYSGERPTVRVTACIYRLTLWNPHHTHTFRTLQASSWRCPLRCFTFQPHRIRTQNTVYLVFKEQNCMTLSPSH